MIKIPDPNYPEYNSRFIKIHSPYYSRKGWKFPYQEDGWPTEDNWYWVFAGYHADTEPTPSTVAMLHWWSNKDQRFLACIGNVVAWAKTKENKNEK